jgi:hypothetical protein
MQFLRDSVSVNPIFVKLSFVMLYICQKDSVLGQGIAWVMWYLLNVWPVDLDSSSFGLNGGLICKKLSLYILKSTVAILNIAKSDYATSLLTCGILTNKLIVHYLTWSSLTELFIASKVWNYNMKNWSWCANVLYLVENLGLVFFWANRHGSRSWRDW